MNRFLRLLLPSVFATAALGLAAPGVATAGTYTVTTNTADDVSGWEFTHAPGFVGCSRLSYPGVCAANDVARPTPLRIFGSGDAIATGVGLWTWYAPLTTTIVKGSVSVSYKTTAPGTSVYLKARTRSESFESVDKLDQTTGDGSNTWAIPANRQVIGLALRSDVKHTYGDKWANTLRISTLTVTLSDTTAPTVAATGPLTLGKWLNQAQKVCLTATADDAGAGVASIELDDQSGRALDSYNVPVQSATQPGLPSLKHDLCVVPSTLGDGVHQLKVVVRDAASETATQSLAVDVDTNAPTAKDEVPTDRTIDRRAPVSFSVDPGASGLSQFTASVDGVPMMISGARASLQPTADFTLGVHTVQWSATDGAGNVGDGQWTFTVTDALPTSITVSGVHRIVPGRSARLTFRVLGDASAVAGARVLLQTRIGSHAYGVGRRLTASATGAVTVTVRPRQTSTYRLSLVSAPAVAAARTVVVAQRLRLAAGALRVRVGHLIRLTPWVASHRGLFRVRVELHTRSGWRLVGRPRINTTLKVRPLARGRYLFRAVAPAGSATTRTSRAVAIRVS